MLAIEMQDLLDVLKLCVPYIAVMIVALIVFLIVEIFAGKFNKKKSGKFMLRSQAAVAFVLVIAVVVNLLCVGPMSNLLTLVSGSGMITDETAAEAEELGEDITEEGIVLLENDGTLPLDTGTPLNVFGWASVSPTYGGSGSGALSGIYENVSLLQGLEDAGFELNSELTEFYESYDVDNANFHNTYGNTGGNTGAVDAERDWTLPQPPVETYPDGIMDRAKEFSDPDDEMPVTGADNGIMLADMRGLDYDDPQWEDFLDQLTFEEMRDLVAYGGYQTIAIDSVGKVATVDCDGPASINNNFTGLGSVGMPCVMMIACTWNKDIAYDYGEMMGRMADEMGTSGWYAPAMNTHRSAFSGRNFEYYSEDGYLAGMMAANAVQGAASHGVYSYIKHFALNDQETNRKSMLCTWSNEQAIREIYLKPFELAVKVGGATGAMTGHNFIGAQWSGVSDALLNTVLRDEWGFRGMCITDGFRVQGYKNADRQIRHGTDLCLIAYDVEYNLVKDESATSVIALRNATHNIMYTVVNSRAYEEENLNPGMETWQKIMIGADVALAIVLVAGEVLAVKGYKKRKDAEPVNG